MGWTDKLAAKAADAAKAGLVRAKDTIETGSASQLRALREMRDDQPVTIEALVVVLVDAVHEESPRELSKRDVKKAGKHTQRVAGGIGMFAGPVGMYIASLYSEAEIVCNVADRHRLVLTDEDLAGHLLVMWNVMPDFPSARAAIDGSGQSVASRMATRLRDRLADKSPDQMTKKDAVLALWRLRGVVKDSSLPGSASAKDVLLPGSRVKAVIKAAELQLGVTGGPTKGIGQHEGREEEQVTGVGGATDPPGPSRLSEVGFFKKRPQQFSGAISKQTFVEEWVAEILQEAGCNRDRAYDMANLAADGVLRQSLKAVAESYHDHNVARYLDGLDLDGLLYRVDEVYNTTIEMATAGRSGPILRERISAFDRRVNETFTSIRSNYVEFARLQYR